MKKRISFLMILILTAICGEISAQQDVVQGASDLSKYILTPKAAPTPRINGARIFGVRPGSEFLFTIAATGIRPMIFSAEGLPRGLKLNPATGRITGRVKKTGEYTVRLSAENALGRYERDLRIVVGDEIALTPPMGWNSWNCWARDVTQEQILSSARAMVEKGLADHGWSYINIDDGWQGRRGGRYNAIQPNKNFPTWRRSRARFTTWACGWAFTRLRGSVPMPLTSAATRTVPMAKMNGSKKDCTTRTIVIKNRAVTTGRIGVKFGTTALTLLWRPM